MPFDKTEYRERRAKGLRGQTSWFLRPGAAGIELGKRRSLSEQIAGHGDPGTRKARRQETAHGTGRLRRRGTL